MILANLIAVGNHGLTWPKLFIVAREKKTVDPQEDFLVVVTNLRN